MSYIPGPIPVENLRLVAGGHTGNYARASDPGDGWALSEHGTSNIQAFTRMKAGAWNGAWYPAAWYSGAWNGEARWSGSTEAWILHHTFEHPIVRMCPVEETPDADVDVVLFALTGGWLGSLSLIRTTGSVVSRVPHEWQQWTEPNAGIFGIAALLPEQDPTPVGLVLAGGGGRIETAPGWRYSRPIPTTTRLNPFNGTPILTACRGDDLWVVAGGEGKLAVSADGITWDLVDSTFDGSCVYAVAFDYVMGWIAVGAEGRVAKSLDGVYWDAVDLASESDCAIDLSGRRVAHRWLSAAPAGDCWIVGGDNNTLATICECPDCYYGYEYQPPIITINPWMYILRSSGTAIGVELDGTQYNKDGTLVAGRVSWLGEDAFGQPLILTWSGTAIYAAGALLKTAPATVLCAGTRNTVDGLELLALTGTGATQTLYKCLLRVNSSWTNLGTIPRASHLHVVRTAVSGSYSGLTQTITPMAASYQFSPSGSAILCYAPPLAAGRTEFPTTSVVRIGGTQQYTPTSRFCGIVWHVDVSTIGNSPVWQVSNLMVDSDNVTLSSYGENSNFPSGVAVSATIELMTSAYWHEESVRVRTIYYSCQYGFDRIEPTSYLVQCPYVEGGGVKYKRTYVPTDLSELEQYQVTATFRDNGSNLASAKILDKETRWSSTVEVKATAAYNSEFGVYTTCGGEGYVPDPTGTPVGYFQETVTIDSEDFAVPARNAIEPRVAAYAIRGNSGYTRVRRDQASQNLPALRRTGYVEYSMENRRDTQARFGIGEKSVDVAFNVNPNYPDTTPPYFQSDSFDYTELVKMRLYNTCKPSSWTPVSLVAGGPDGSSAILLAEFIGPSNLVLFPATGSPRIEPVVTYATVLSAITSHACLTAPADGSPCP